MTTTETYEDERNHFVDYLHGVAKQIADMIDGGASLEAMALALDSKRELSGGFIQRWLNFYDRRDFPGASLDRSSREAALARMLIYVMVRQREFDAGKAQT